MRTLLNNSDFEREVLFNEKVVVVEFFLDWCGTSHIIAPILKKTEAQYEDLVQFYRVDKDRNNELCEQYGVYEIPTILFFKESRVVDEINGGFPRILIEQKLDRLLRIDEGAASDAQLNEARI
ncbi:MAG: hypothetical protein JSV84_13310 [Gemmatimonadota bacterium]|nr:MAG: hypothetical protein JSV84_13310 [Gemmatimonadota bacterium]